MLFFFSISLSSRLSCPIRMKTGRDHELYWFLISSQIWSLQHTENSWLITWNQYRIVKCRMKSLMFRGKWYIIKEQVNQWHHQRLLPGSSDSRFCSLFTARRSLNLEREFSPQKGIRDISLRAYVRKEEETCIFSSCFHRAYSSLGLESRGYRN